MKNKWIFLSLIFFYSSAEASVLLTSFSFQGEQAGSLFQVLKNGKDRSDIDLGDTEFIRSERSEKALGIKEVKLETIEYKLKNGESIVTCENSNIEPGYVQPFCTFQNQWASIEDGQLIIPARPGALLFNLANTTDLSKLDWKSLKNGFSFNIDKIKFTCFEPNFVDFDSLELLNNDCSEAVVTIGE